MHTKLRDGESVVLETNRHWIIFYPSVVGLSVCLFLLSFFVWSPSAHPSLLKMTLVATGGLAIYFVYKYYDRQQDIWVVTNMRLINEWGVFTMNVKESPLDKINNVSFSKPIMGAFLNFGDVEVQTAAEQGATIIQFVKDPELLQTTITRCQADYKLSPDCKPGSQPPPAAATTDTKECPNCAETIRAKAKICRFCNKELPSNSKQEGELN